MPSRSRATTRASPASPASPRSAARCPTGRCTPTTCTSCGSTGRSPGAGRDDYATALTAEGIGTGLHFLAAHELTYYRRRFPDLRLPVAERAAREVLSLPLSPAHSLADIDDAVTALRKVHARYAGG